MQFIIVIMLKCPECETEIEYPPDTKRNYFWKCSNCDQWVYFDTKLQDVLIITEEIIPKDKPLTFFSHSFYEEDRQMNNLFMDMLLFLYIPVLSVEYDLSSRDKVEKARELIKASNMVFIVMSKRCKCIDNDNDEFWKTSDWLQNEVGMACAFKRQLIAIVEENVRDDGILKDVRFCYRFNRNNLVLPWIEDNLNRNVEDTKTYLIHILEYINSWEKNTKSY